jgi:glycosyltransferase involved in cell wall biosynthesis
MRSLDTETWCFCVSSSGKRDFLKSIGDFGRSLDENKMIVTPNATANVFSLRYDKIMLNSIFKKYGIDHKNSDNYIFSLCSIDPRKNLLFTVTCFIKFIQKHTISNLYFYLGGAHFTDFIAQFEEKLELFTEYRDKIVRLGYVDDEDVNILYSNSLFFTYLSQYEGFGMPPLEAMQAGTPVITSNNSSLPEVVGDAAISIDYDSEEQCIKAFEDLYFNESLRKEYIAKGFERAKLFSWEKTVGKMTDVIMMAVSSERGKS